MLNMHILEVKETERKHRILVKNMIDYKFLNANFKRRKLIKHDFALFQLHMNMSNN